MLTLWTANAIPSKATLTKQVPVDELAAIENFKWITKLEFSETLTKLIDLQKFEASYNEKLADYLTNTQKYLDKLILCDMTPYGKGLFARTDIEEGEIITYYLGTQLLAQETNYQSYYALSTLENIDISAKGYSRIFKAARESIENKAESSTNDTTNRLGLQNVDAEKAGNEARYFQHLPRADSMEVRFTANKDLIATANLELSVNEIIPGVKIVQLKASRKIKAGEIMGLDYSLSYWENQKLTPAFFDNVGNVLPAVIPYVKWSSAALTIGDICINFSKNQDNISQNMIGEVLRDILVKINPLIIDAPKTLIDELHEFKISNDPDDTCIGLLKLLADNEEIFNLVIQQAIDNCYKNKNLELILGKDSTYYHYIGAVSPNWQKRLDETRATVFYEKEVVGILDQKLPTNAHWKFRKDAKTLRFTFWSTGSESEIKKIGKSLKAISIKFDAGAIKGKGSDNHSIQLQQPDFNKLCMIKYKK